MAKCCLFVARIQLRSTLVVSTSPLGLDAVVRGLVVALRSIDPAVVDRLDSLSKIEYEWLVYFSHLTTAVLGKIHIQVGTGLGG
jgi:hypothetical protein